MAMTIRKWGNSLAVRIPKSVAQRLNLKPGMKDSDFRSPFARSQTLASRILTTAKSGLV